MKKLLFFIIFIFYNSSYAAVGDYNVFIDSDDYNDDGTIVENPREDNVDYTNKKQYKMPKIIEEKRTYGQINIKNKNSESHDEREFDINEFVSLYKKSGNPKIVFFIEHKFNDAIGVHGNIKNKIEQAGITKDYILSERQKQLRDKLIERRWLIQDEIVNEFLDQGVSLVDRNVIVRLVESEYYKKGNLPSSKSNVVVLDNNILQLENGANLNVDMLNNYLEMEALKQYVDFIVELKISDYSSKKFPTLRAKIFNISDGTTVGAVTKKHEDNIIETEEYVATNDGYKKVKKYKFKDENNENEYEATNSGYKIKYEERELELDKYSKSFSHNIMSKFVLYFNKEKR